jgi:hypothetical protein
VEDLPILKLKDPVDCSEDERDLKRNLETLYLNDCKGPSFTDKTPELTTSPVYCFGANSTNDFKTAQAPSYSRLFENKPIEETSLNCSADEVRAALGKQSSAAAISMSQISHIPLNPPYNDEIDINNDFLILIYL